MEERNQQIVQYLRNEEVQQRILKDMQRAREEASVTISNAARLFGFTENQLRDWEDKGLLRPQRNVQDSSFNGKGAKRRQYSTNELSKLAIIRELMNAKFSPGAIPPTIDEIWAAVTGGKELSRQTFQENNSAPRHRDIDSYAYVAYKDLFWRYYSSQALRFAITLICEGIPPIPAGLILPARHQEGLKIKSVEDLPMLGKSLVGWLGQTRSFYTYLVDYPSFEYQSDYRVVPLQTRDEVEATDDTWIVVDREAAKHVIHRDEEGERLRLSKDIVETVRRLLSPIYEDVEEWERYFGDGIRDVVNPVFEFDSGLVKADIILTGLANMVLRLSGKKAWSFCCILLPKDASLPVQQRNLVVRAQSKNAPYSVAASFVSSKIPGLSLRAYQSGQIIYRENVSTKDFMVAYRECEESTRSAIALPIAGEDGMAIGVIYIASNEAEAFSEDDQRVLRVVGRMIEELVMIYRVRQLAPGSLTGTITAPKTVDASFREFLAESDFVNDVEAMLADVQAKDESEISPEEEMSFIAVDIDNQTSFALKYGDQVARNLSRAVGLRLQGQLRLFADLQHQRLYHLYADKFYLFLKDFSLEEVRSRAYAFKKILEGEYLIDVQRVSMGRPLSREDLLRIPRITVRFGISSYKTTKLKEILNRYIPETAIVQVAGLISRSLEEALVTGQQMGGSCIISWDHIKWGYFPWLPAPFSE